MEEDIKLTQQMLAALTDRIGINQTMLDRLLQQRNFGQRPDSAIGNIQDNAVSAKDVADSADDATGRVDLPRSPSPSPSPHRTLPSPGRYLGDCSPPEDKVTEPSTPHGIHAIYNDIECQRKLFHEALDNASGATAGSFGRKEEDLGVRRRKVEQRVVVESDKGIQTDDTSNSKLVFRSTKAHSSSK
jgi:hypothetical protein